MRNDCEIECEFEMAYLHIYSIYARVLLIFPNFAVKLSHTRKIEATEDVEIWTGLTGFTSIEEDSRVEVERWEKSLSSVKIS